MHSCDMIKGNESDVGNIDFWVTCFESWQILMFYIIFELQRIVYISVTRYQIEMGFGSKYSIFNVQMILYWKIKIEYCQHVTHSFYTFYFFNFIHTHLVSSMDAIKCLHVSIIIKIIWTTSHIFIKQHVWHTRNLDQFWFLWRDIFNMTRKYKFQ